MNGKTQRLVESTYLSFPFRVDPDGPVMSRREAHVKEQIEQVLFTDPMERVFRPHFGAGVRSLVFEPNSSSLWKLAHTRLVSSLVEVLLGEVDPKSLDVSVTGDGEVLTLTVSYRLATINRTEKYKLQVDGESLG